jgi:hypothetical protein
MKKALLLFTIAATLFACKKDAKDFSATDSGTTAGTAASASSTVATSSTNSQGRIPAGYEIAPCIVEVETPLMAGQAVNVGSVSVWNDATNVYVSYYTTGDYRIRKTHLYVGACSSIPTNNAGNPRIGQFPYQVSHGTTGISEYVYTIPRSSLPAGCLCIAAHAEVVAYDAAGSLVFSETGWGFGEEINDGGSWAMKFNYCQQDCDGNPPR